MILRVGTSKPVHFMLHLLRLANYLLQGYSLPFKTKAFNDDSFFMIRAWFRRDMPTWLSRSTFVIFSVKIKQVLFIENGSYEWPDRSKRIAIDGFEEFPT